MPAKNSFQLKRRSEEKSSVPVYVLTGIDNGAAAVEIVTMGEQVKPKTLGTAYAFPRTDTPTDVRFASRILSIGLYPSTF
jgi:hypothetical protein